MDLTECKTWEQLEQWVEEQIEALTPAQFKKFLKEREKLRRKNVD